MRNCSMIFAAATVRLSLPGLTTRRGATASFAAGGSLAPSGRYVARSIKIIVFAMLLALTALPAPAPAQTITISSATASPATVRPGQTVAFTASITDNQNDSNYPVLFSLVAPGASPSIKTMQQLFSATFTAGAPLTKAFSWTVPTGAQTGTYTMYVAVYNPAYSVKFAQNTTALTVTAASVAAAAPTNLEPPVVSGTAQVGNVLSSTTGTWTGATSYAYQWAGNSANIAGATAATYTPVSTDAGHTLTSTVRATGSSGAAASATSAPTVAIVAASTGSPPVTASGSVPFVALHTYYMSPTGSDSNNGLTATTAWASPNHALNCGDVIIASAGSYADLQSWGKISNCPSTSGGIDGTGGVYFATLLCGGSYVGACDITTKTNTTGNTVAMEVTASNWAIEGWYVNTGDHGRAFEAYACSYDSGMKHHIAFINDISANNLQGADTNDCGQNAGSTTVPSPVGTDYFAVVGMIAQNSAQDPICLAAIDVVYPGVYDNNAGTHYFIYGNFSYANQNVTCRSQSDTESYMFDTFSEHYAINAGVIANNIGYDSDRMCIQIFDNRTGSTAVNYKIYNNTCYRDNLNINSDYMDGEINLNVASGSVEWTVTTSNNIAYQPLSAPLSGSGGIAAWVYFPSYGFSGTMNNGASGSQNVYMANNTSCKRTYCNSAHNAESQASGLLGTNTYISPSFTNTTDLLANQVGVPNCNAFANTTECMGWNANTNTLTTPSVISDLVPTASGTTVKGYQKPSTTCAANADYPTWLKGIVYLQWNGSTLSENSGLITRPCNM